MGRREEGKVDPLEMKCIDDIARGVDRFDAGNCSIIGLLFGIFLSERAMPFHYASNIEQ